MKYIKIILSSIKYKITILEYFVKRLVTKEGSRDEYCIKKPYKARIDNLNFDDTGNKDEYQDGIYLAAKNLAIEHNFKKILDIGCGSGYKLLKYFSNCETLGLEIEPTLSYLKNQYPDRNWELSDFNSSLENKFDLILAVDIIEHLLYPNELLEFILRTECSYVIISTPARDKLGKLSNIGPPRNKSHVREWSQKEFVEYISKYFNVIHSEVLSDVDHYVLIKK